MESNITRLNLRAASIEYEEFDKLMDRTYNKMLTERQKKDIFTLMDSNSKGSISISQFLQSMEIIHSNPKLVAFDYELPIWRK